MTHKWNFSSHNLSKRRRIIAWVIL